MRLEGRRQRRQEGWFWSPPPPSLPTDYAAQGHSGVGALYTASPFWGGGVKLVLLVGLSLHAPGPGTTHLQAEAGERGFSPSLLWSESEESRAKGLRPLGSLVSGLVIGLD